MSEIEYKYVKNLGGVVHQVTLDQFSVIAGQKGMVELTKAEFDAEIKAALKTPRPDIAAAIATSTDERFKGLEQKAEGYEDRLTKLEQAHSKKQGPMTPVLADPSEVNPENTPTNTVEASTTPAIIGGAGATSDTNGRDGGRTRVR